MKNAMILGALILTGCGTAAPVRFMAGEEPVRPGRPAGSIEAVQGLRRSALERDGASCRAWLERIAGNDATMSQRMDARLTIADLLARGPIHDADGLDATAALHYQLAWSWTTSEPRSARMSMRHADLYRLAGGKTEIPLSRAPSLGIQPTKVDGLVEEQGTVWGGGHDRLYLTTGLLAFLTDEQGTPSFRGTHLRLRNAGLTPVFVTARPAGELHRELKPGEEVLRPLALSSRTTTGVDVTVRQGRPSGLAVGR